jgi:hypothetical protein
MSPGTDPLTTTWRVSSFSTADSGNCVEVANLLTHVAIRDTKNRGSAKLSVSPAAWRSFVSVLRQS